MRYYYCLPIGSKIPILSKEEHFGGNAVNVAVGLRRFGIKTALVTSLNASNPCKEVIKNLKQNRVTTKYITINGKGDVNLSYILDWHKDKGDRVILSYHQKKDFAKIKLPQTRWIYLSSLGEYFRQIIRQIPPGMRIAINPGLADITHENTLLLRVLRKTDVLIVNKNEGALLANVDENTDDVEFLLVNLLKLGPKVVAITNGKHGVWARTKIEHKSCSVKALTVPVKEVTGAGDAFSSGFLAAHLNKKPLIECLRWGVLNASACIQKIGAQNGLLTFDTLKKEYKKHYRK